VKAPKSVPLRYALALAVFALILFLSTALDRWLSVRFDPTSLIILWMIASSWYLGIGPGLVVAICFELTLQYFSPASPAARFYIILFNRLVLFISVVVFASSRRNAEKRLRQQREWLKVTLSSIGDAVIATDTDDRVSFINPAAQRLTGWTEGEAVGRPLDEVFSVISEETRERINSPADTIKKVGGIVGLANHTLLVSKSGREIPIEDSGAPILDSNGSIIGVIVVFHDVTDHRRNEEERERLLISEREARNRAETSDRLKDEFLATVSHELRTPLSAILGWSAMLNLGMLGEDTRRNALAIIERNARAQAEIISDILDVSRIITGKLNIQSRSVELAPVLKAAIETLQLAASAKNIRLEVFMDSRSAVVTGDPERLQQIFWNLLSNAIKFTPQNGEIDVRLECVELHVELTVKDNGIGISSDFLPFVFERFRQADSSTTREHAGLGLGLAIVRHLTELHGGSVAAFSEGEGQGAIFRVRLPLAVERESEPPCNQQSWIADKAEEQVGEMSIPELTRVKILIVDDEADTLDVLTTMLTQTGALVQAAQSSAQAFELFQTWQPDVLLSDLGMPGEDGFGLIQKIRALPQEKGGDVPAAALTAHVRDEDRSRALAAGYDAHIVKPVDPHTLANAVAGLLQTNKV
jgi:PAS domain S-box-containing protein